jgi:hypothetical protein
MVKNLKNKVILHSLTYKINQAHIYTRLEAWNILFSVRRNKRNFIVYLVNRLGHIKVCYGV